MEKLTTIVLGFLVAAVLLFIGAVAGGTILYLIWPVCIPAVFPKLVANGWLAGKLLWWQAVTFVWVAGILFRTTVTKKED